MRAIVGYAFAGLALAVAIQVALADPMPIAAPYLVGAALIAALAALFGKDRSLLASGVGAAVVGALGVGAVGVLAVVPGALILAGYAARFERAPQAVLPE